MTSQGYKSTFWLLFVAAVIGALLGVTLPATPTRALPPRPPTPTPTVVPAPVALSFHSGGSLLLDVRFPTVWPGVERPWQGLWTVVQWQDDKGIWRNVEGWQGTLDGVETQEDGEAVGWKTWWVAERDLGTGPFRWVIYEGKGGRRLVQSEPFDLPGSVNASVLVEVSLAP